METAQTYEVRVYASESDYFNGKGTLVEIDIEEGSEAVGMAYNLTKYYYASQVQSKTGEFKRVFRGDKAMLIGF